PFVQLPALLEPRRQLELVPHALGLGLARGEATTAVLGDLEQDPTRLGEVRRAEEVAVDDARRVGAQRRHALAPRLELIGHASPRHVLDDTAAEAALDLGGGVDLVPAAA